MNEEIHSEKLNLSYKKINVINDLNIVIKKNKITALIGSNGSGKSTILKALARIIKPSKGDVYLNGKSIYQYTSKEVAKLLSILPQSSEAPLDFSVLQLVQLGRFPNQNFMGSLNKHDHEKIEWALHSTDMFNLKDRKLSELSGGQKQRAWISMALAQGGDYLFLDEPTTYLDMKHQIEVLNVLKKLNENEKKTIVMVLHDINQAAKFAHHIIAIKKGKIYFEGSIPEIMNAQRIESIFGVKGIIINEYKMNTPLFFPEEVSNV